MDYTNMAVMAVVVAFIIWRLMPVKGIRNISIGELKPLLKEKNKQLIDVRTTGEFKHRNIKGFVNIPLQQLDAKAGNLSRDAEIVVICQSGMRSARACRQLKKMGFKHITNVRGGMSAWSE